MFHFRMPRTGALLLLLALLISACGGDAQQPQTGGGQTGGGQTGGGQTPAATSGGGQGSATVTWAFWGSPEEKTTHEKVAQAFMQEHPEITIEIWHQPWNDYFTKLQTIWASGDQAAVPDVMFLFPVQRYAQDGVLENLDPWIEKSSYNLEDYWPALLESARHDGHLYGFPRDISSEVLYYNKALFDEAGVAYPTDEWTWNDLRAAAEKLTKVEPNGRVSRYALAMEAGKYQLFVGQNKGGILDDMRNPSKCTLDQPPAVEAITFFTDLMEQNHAMRDAALSQSGGDAAVFQSGQAAMIIQNSSRVSAFNEAGMSYDVVPVPIPEGGQRSGSAGGAAWTMSATSDNKEAAWTFLSWLQSTNGGQKIYTDSGEIFPALRSTAQSESFLKSDKPPQNRQAFLTEAENAKPGRFGYFPEWSELSSSSLDAGLQRLWAGEAQPEQALPEICQKVNQFLQEKGFPK